MPTDQISYSSLKSIIYAFCERYKTSKLVLKSKTFSLTSLYTVTVLESSRYADEYRGYLPKFFA